MFFINQIILWIVMAAAVALIPAVTDLSHDRSQPTEARPAVDDRPLPDSIQESAMTPPCLPRDNSKDNKAQLPIYPYGLYDGGSKSLPVAQVPVCPDRSGGTTVWTAPVLYPDGADYFRCRRAGDDDFENACDTIIVMNGMPRKNMETLNP
jgi:hypothetical protein